MTTRDPLQLKIGAPANPLDADCCELCPHDTEAAEALVYIGRGSRSFLWVCPECAAELHKILAGHFGTFAEQILWALSSLSPLPWRARDRWTFEASNLDHYLSACRFDPHECGSRIMSETGSRWAVQCCRRPPSKETAEGFGETLAEAWRACMEQLPANVRAIVSR